MKFLFKSLFLIVLVTLFSSNLSAQILFKVEKTGSDKTGYILGTHHFAPLSVIDSIKELPEILKSIDGLYGEIDMSGMNDPALMMSVQSKLLAPADSTLDKLLTKAELDSVRVVWDNYSGGMVPFDMLTRMKPSVIATQLASLMVMKDLPELNPLEGIDITMQTRARELGKPVYGFETIEMQMDLLYGEPIAEQARALMKAVRDPEKQMGLVKKLNSAYLNRDLDKILQLMTEEEGNNPETYEQMIFSRNENWMDSLAEILPNQSILAVVGAGHLPGPRGLIQLLRNAGYTVTPIM